MKRATTTKIRYIAEPKHVREVTLIGPADFGFWGDYLKAEGLAPVRCGDSAEVMIVAAEMVYLGLRFTEVSFSVRAVPVQGNSGAGMRLLRAFTSNRIFAWFERRVFTTPYAHGDCQVSIHIPTSVWLAAQGKPIFSAEMSSVERPNLRTGEERWEGPVFLPPRGRANESRLFFGRFSGHTVVYPFSTDDRFAIDSTAGGGALQPLADSSFHPQQWIVRADATHGKSKTYRRTDIFRDEPVAEQNHLCLALC
jgi:hypothetical protein